MAPKAAVNPKTTEFPNDIPRYLTPNPYESPPIPQSNPMTKVKNNILLEAAPIISANPGTVSHAAKGGTISHENNPPTIQ